MPKPIRCPGIACGGTMYPECRHSVTADRCERCGGLWFDVEELDAWLGNAGSLELGRIESQVPERGLGSRPCPRCDRALDTAGWTDLVLDRCRTCRGLFVEASEFVRIQKHGLPAEHVTFESRFAEWMANAGVTVYVASQLAYLIARFLRR